MRSKSPITTNEEGEELLPLATPGDILLSEFMEPFGLSVNALALALRVPATRMLAIVKGKRSITADTSLRLARYFGMSDSFFLNLQTNYDLGITKREKLAAINLEVIPRRSAA